MEGVTEKNKEILSWKFLDMEGGGDQARRENPLLEELCLFNHGRVFVGSVCLFFFCLVYICIWVD